MSEIAVKNDLTTCPSVKFIFMRHVGGPLKNAMPVCMYVNDKPVIRLADYSICQFGAPKDVVIEGSATVELCGLPIARVGDHMIHGGFIITGSSNVFVGGPTFKLPKVLTIRGSPEFRNITVRELYGISETPSGQELFSRLDAAEQDVVISEGHDANAYALPANQDAAENGNPTGTSVMWNPDFRANVYDTSGNMIAEPPTAILFHEMVHALANSEGRNHFNVIDPAPPASEPTLDEGEAQAIGAGSHNGDYPTENSLRRDLGLPRRDNHGGIGPTDGEPPPLDLRPGAC